MKIIYNNGEVDFSDEGSQAREMENQTEIRLLVDKLSPRQREIFYLKLDGYTSKEIGSKLKLDKKTIDREWKTIKMSLRQ